MYNTGPVDIYDFHRMENVFWARKKNEYKNRSGDEIE